MSYKHIYHDLNGEMHDMTKPKERAFQSELNPLFGSTTVTITSDRMCQHKNGWYDSVGFGPFTTRFFVCSDCETIRDPETMRLI